MSLAFVYKPSVFMLPDSHYDKEKADRAVAFIENLCHTKGKWAGKPFLLLPWQEQIVRDLFGIVKEDGKRQFLTAYIEIPKKNGKQLALDTPIPTPDGWKTMGTIAIGDCVFDERGKPCHVVAKSLIDDTEQAYELVFRDGGRIVAGERHLWDVEYIHGKTRPKRWTTGEIYRRTRKYRETFSDNRSIIRIPVNAPLHLPEADLPVDPYLYGYWLGNGCATKPEITVRDCDVDDLISFIPYLLHNRYPQVCGGSEILVYKELKKILVIGIPAGLQGMMFSIANVCIQSAINSFGSNAIAGSAAALNFEFFAYFIVNAFAQTTVTFTSQNYGAGEVDRCKKIFRLNMVFSLIFCGMLSAVFVLGRGFFLRLYTTDEAVLVFAAQRLLIATTLELLTSTYEISAGAMRGLGHSLLPAVITCVGSCLLRLVWIATACRLVHDFGLLMIIYPISWVITGTAMLTAYFCIRKKCFKSLGRF